MKKQLVCAFAISMTLLGCDVSIKDGKVPSKYVSDAQKYVGVYHGQFEGRQMDLKLAILADRTAQLTVADLNGNSELIAGCQAPIGSLISAAVDSGEKTLKSVSFAFKGQLCKIAGTEVTLDFKSENDLTVSVVKTTHLEHEMGDVDCTEGPHGTHCHQVPGPIVQVPDQYLTGSFSK